MWWGDIALAPDAATFWHIGPLQFSLQRRPRSWNLEHARSRDSESMDFEIGVPELREIPNATSLRLQFTNSPDSLKLKPASSDRPFVIRTEAPVLLAAGQEVCFYVSTVMRLALSHGGTLLTEIPIFDLKDTWFGAIIDGELCYASTTSARADFSALPVRPYRPVTPVTVINNTSKSLLLDKFKLPAPSLSLYSNAAGRLFTDGVHVVFRAPQNDVEVSVTRGTNEHLSRDIDVAPPRQLINRLQTFTMGSFFK